jgi:hypothetical protein
MSTLRVDRIEPYLSSSVSIEGAIQANAATTGSNTFVGDQNIQGTLTASLQDGYVWVGAAGNISALVATSSFGGGSGDGFPYTGDAVITGSLLVSGSATTDLTVIGNQIVSGTLDIRSTGGLGLSNSNGTTVEYFGNSFGGNIGVYKVSDATEIGLALDGAQWTTNWGNGPILYVNNTPGDTYEGVFGFQDKTNYTDGRITALKPLVLQQGAVITGSLTASVIEIGQEFGDGINLYQGGFSQIRFYSGSNQTEVGTWVNMQVNPSNGALAISSFPSNNHFVDFDVATTSSVFDAPIRGFGGNLRIGSNTTITGILTISGSSHSNTIGQRTLQIAKPGFNYPVFLSQYTDQSSSILLNYTENLSATASYNVGVFDNAFTQDVELLIATTIGHGIQFKDIRSDTGLYVDFLKIAPNGGSNPPLEFKRSAEVTGSVSISDVLQLAQKDPLPTGAVGQLAVSASNLYYHNGTTWVNISSEGG